MEDGMHKEDGMYMVDGTNLSRNFFRGMRRLRDERAVTDRTRNIPEKLR